MPRTEPIYQHRPNVGGSDLKVVEATIESQFAIYDNLPFNIRKLVGTLPTSTLLEPVKYYVDQLGAETAERYFIEFFSKRYPGWKSRP